MMYLRQFIEGKSENIALNAQIIYDFLTDNFPLLQADWKWNTLVFNYNHKVALYFGVKQELLKIGFWDKKVISSPIIKRELKLTGYYLIRDITEELLADILISVDETIKARRKK